MNYDAAKLAEIRETRRHNLEAEEAERLKAKAAQTTAIAKMGDTVLKGATGVAGILKGKNDGKWGMTDDPILDSTYDQSYVALDLENKTLPNGYKRMASVAIVDFAPMLGAVDGSSVNTTFLAMKRIYDIMREKNRGATNYTVANVTQYFLPCMSIAAQVAFHELLLKIAHNPTLKMRVTMRSIFNALGIDFASFSANLADFEIRLQKLKAVLDEFPMPVDLPVLKRWVWLSSFAFLDSPERNSSIYICRPKYYFTPFTAGPHSICTTDITIGATAAPSANRTYTQICNSLDTMESVLHRMLLDTTLQAVAGDIFNAFGNALVPWSKLNADAYENPFYHDEEFLLELTNARIVKRLGDGTWEGTSVIYDKFGNIGQGYLDATGRFAPFFGSFRDTYFSSIASGQGVGETIFTDGHEALNREQTNMAESWMHTYSGASGSRTFYYWDDTTPGSEFQPKTISALANEKFGNILSYGTEIITLINVCYVDRYDHVIIGIVQDSNEALNMEDVYTATCFDHYPWRYYLDENNSARIVCTDIDAYGVIAESSLQNSTRIKNMALWGYATLKSAKVTRSDRGDKGKPKSKGDKGTPSPTPAK